MRKRRRMILVVVTLLYLTVTIFGGCADTFLLHPSNQPIPLNGAVRLEVPVPDRPPVEAVTLAMNVQSGDSPTAYLLIFDGNGGRAESAVHWGSTAIGGRSVEVWSMNYPGFGSSPGKAQLSAIAPAAIATYDAIKQKAGDKPIVIWGLSMGSTAALYVAAHRPVSGIILTNPPPLKPLILRRYGWWNLWLLAIPVSRGIPDELDSVANGALSKAPALISSANEDGLVPANYHQMVIDAYAGPKQVVRLPNVGHDSSPAKASPAAWSQGVEWLWTHVGR